MDPSKNLGQVPNQNVQQSQTQTPTVGAIHKEQGSTIPVVQTSEFVKPSEPEPQVPSELKEMGVKPVSHVPTLTDEHQQAGIYHAKESVPVSAEPSGMVKLPMTKMEAQSVLKMHKKVSDSIKWLASLILKYFKTSQKPIVF